MNLAWLKELFAGFLRTRHIARHFRRLALLDTLVQTSVSREYPPRWRTHWWPRLKATPRLSSRRSTAMPMA